MPTCLPAYLGLQTASVISGLPERPEAAPAAGLEGGPARINIPAAQTVERYIETMMPSSSAPKLRFLVAPAFFVRVAFTTFLLALVLWVWTTRRRLIEKATEAWTSSGYSKNAEPEDTATPE